MLIFTPLLRSACLGRLLVLLGLLSSSLGWAQGGPRAHDAEAPPMEDVINLTPLQVYGVRPEEFGFRITGQLVLGLSSSHNFVMIWEVLPNTAAAKAGLRPGELLIKFNGSSPWLNIFKINKLQKLQWVPSAPGKTMTCTMEVRAPGAKESRTVTMTMPSPAPRWGSEKWHTPEGRLSAVVKETGPLATLARELLDNGIWSMQFDTGLMEAPPCNEAPLLGYRWMIQETAGTHTIWVSQQRGKTEILLSFYSKENGRRSFLTSPTGAMDKARSWAPKIKGERREFSAEEIRAQFEAEIDFWLHKVGRVTGRWPFEALAGETAVASGASNASREPAKVRAPLAESFLKLPVATAAQKELFLAALGKVGLDEEHWAYTETKRSFEDNRVTTVRYDPAKPPEERSTLLKVDGKAPKAAYLQQWRKEGRGALPGLGDLPPIADLVDVNDVRVYADEMTAVVFELPVKATNAGFPAEKFQARFRVNKTHRGFEDFSVKLRESMGVAGIATVTDAGLEARFQALDPALAPQPVFLKMGGGVRVLLVKFSRAFEVKRTNFQRGLPPLPALGVE